MQMLSQTIVPKEWKKGWKCPQCGTVHKFYHYEFDSKFLSILENILAHCLEKKSFLFNRKEVFSPLFREIAEDYGKQLSKIQYFGVIRWTGKQNIWELTKKGYQFLKGRGSIPKHAWVAPRRLGGQVMKDDLLVTVWQVEPSYKVERYQWTLDYVLTSWR